MTGYVLASLIFLGGVITAVLGELINEEIRGWLDYLPRAILRLAAGRLDPAGKITIYEDEWLPELTCILGGADARPITRLIIGLKFSAGLLITANRIARHLHRAPASATQPQPAQAGAAFPASRQHIISVQVLEARLRLVAEFRAAIAPAMDVGKHALDTLMACETDQASSEEARIQYRRSADCIRAALEDSRRRDARMKAKERDISYSIHLLRAGGQHPASR